MSIDTDVPTETTTIDEEEVGAFSEQILGWYTGSFVTYMIDLGLRTGLFDAAAEGPATSQQLADRAGLLERYVREWLGAVTTAGIVDYEPTTETYTLPAARAICLSGDSELNLAPLSQMSSHLGPFVGRVADAFRHGGGVPYSEYQPDFTDVMDGLNRPAFDALLVDTIVPLAEGLSEQLTRGIRVADIGCGTGHTTNLLGQAFPASTFVGYDLAEPAIARATTEAAEYGLTNTTFVVHDVAELPTDPKLGAAFAFDAIHDQADPAGVLQRIFDALGPGGVFVMYDIRASSHLEHNLDNPVAPWLYAVSTLHCMTVSLACDGAGLGTVWGEELALEMLTATGFVDIEVHGLEADPMNSIYVARKPV